MPKGHVTTKHAPKAGTNYSLTLRHSRCTGPRAEACAQLQAGLSSSSGLGSQYKHAAAVPAPDASSTLLGTGGSELRTYMS